MTGSLSSWAEIERLRPRLLLLVDSGTGEVESFDRTVSAIERYVGNENVFIVARQFWKPRLFAHGFRRSQLLYARDRSGRDIEVVDFLKEAAAIRWIARLGVHLIMPAAPYSLYNDQVKSALELRVCAVLGHARFVTHALPEEYVYLFDAWQLCRRQARAARVSAYQRTAMSIVEDLYQQWIAQGRPASSDNRDFREEERILAAHLGPAILEFDESSPIPIARPPSEEHVRRAFEYVQTSLLNALRGS